jgi:hypothetical protein
MGDLWRLRKNVHNSAAWIFNLPGKSILDFPFVRTDDYINRFEYSMQEILFRKPESTNVVCIL